MAISPSSVSIQKGNQASFTMSSVSGAVYYVWTCSDPSQSLSQSGRNCTLTGVNNTLSDITCTLTCEAQDSAHDYLTSSSASVTITIIHVSRVTLSPSSVTKYDLNGFYLTPTISPYNATNPAVTWSSSNPTVATVSGGYVTPVGNGSCTITVTTNDGNYTTTSSVTIAVPIAVTGVSVSPTSMSLTYGNTTGTVTATVTPSNATDKTINWSSSNTNVGTVNSSGVVTGVGNGSCAITATTNDGGFTASCSVSANLTPPVIHVTGVSVSPSSYTFTSAGSSLQLSATISPSNATNKTVSWSSSNSSVATVSSSGLVTSVTNGSATITATTQDGGYTSSCSITVNIPPPVVHVTGVSVNPTSISLNIGGNIQLTNTISPSNADNKTVSWSSSNTSVATVNSSGYVTAIATGTSTITVTTQDGGYSAYCNVTVASPRPSNWSWSYNIVSGGAVYRTSIVGGNIIVYIILYTEWNSFTSRINDFRRYKGLTDYSFTTAQSEMNFTPSIVDEAITAINQMGYSLSIIGSGNMSASVFTSMRDTLNSIT
jgi:uncharacterized protein YjdB